MKAERFEKLIIRSRILEGEKGYTELCQRETGEKEIRVSILDPSLQECLLLQSDGTLPLRMRGDCLEILFPWQEGQSLKEWIFYGKPDFAQRKKACLSLLEQMVTQPVPVDLLALSARKENLRFGPEGLRLQIFPELGNWTQELGTAQAVRSVAELVTLILSDTMENRIDQEPSDELKLLIQRSGAGAYQSWELLQADLYRIPDQPALRMRKLLSIKKSIQGMVQKWKKKILPFAVIVLVLTALVSAASAFVQWREKVQAERWPGIIRIGRETIAGEEEDP